MTATLAPPLPALDWLNAIGPVGPVPRSGALTALVFANLGSSWSQHRLRALEALCARHAPRLQAFGVHVPRFDHERDPRRMRRQLHRLGIRLPVAHDPDWTAWQHYGVSAWPTVVLIDVGGEVRLRLEGDGPLGRLEAEVEALARDLVLPDYDDETQPRASREPDMALHFPVGLAVAPQYLYVADCCHHRVLECNHAGRILRQFGTGAADFVDGPGDQAAFRMPHGLCLARDALYVADAGNHAVRRIDLRSGEVATLCGTGEPGAPPREGSDDPRQARLDDPRAVAVVHAHLYLALAGDNTLWRYDLSRGTLAHVAGSGALDVADGAGAEAAFAQPVALAAVQQALYVCDAAGSAIRAVHLHDGRVQTLVGQGPWDFGQADGARAQARMQAPHAIALDPDAPLLWIADAGNDRLRSLRLGGGEVSSYTLSQPLHGPAGLAMGAGAVWIADTDAHAVLRLDPHTGALHHVPVGE
jgi:hypothetical protein